MKKFLAVFTALTFAFAPLAFGYFSPDSEEYEIVFEGATADDYETTLAVTDPTADRTITLPNNSGTLNISATGYTENVVFEGATADAYETTLAITDPTADRTITFTDATGTVSLLGSAESFSGVKTFTADPIVGGTTPNLTIGDAGEEDAQITFDGNAQDFALGLDDTADDLVLSMDSALGTTNIMAISDTPTTIVYHDASAADATFTLDGNAVDFSTGLDDSADKWTLSKGAALGTTNILAIANTPTAVTVHDASEADASFIFDGAAADFSIGLDDSGDTFSLSLGSALGTTEVFKADGTTVTFTDVVTISTAPLTIPAAADCSAHTGEGQLCWDSDDDDLSIGDGSAALTVTFD